MNFETKQTEKTTYQVTAIVPFKKVETEKQHVLEHFKEHVEIKGFRKGNAPLGKVEKAVDKSHLHGEIINHLVPEVYSQLLKETKIQPIVSPRINIKEFNYEEKKDLMLEFILITKPEVKLPDYKNLKVAPKIIKPSDPAEASKPSIEEKQAKALQELLKNSEAEVPQVLIDEEVDRYMAGLVDRTEQMGLTPEQYLKAVNKTPESLRGEYAAKAKQSLKQEFVLQEIALKENITAGEKEVEEMINASGDDKIKEELRKPEHRAYIENIIVKRKVLDLISK